MLTLIILILIVTLFVLAILPKEAEGEPELHFPEGEERELSAKEWAAYWSLYHNVSQDLSLGIAKCESRFDPNARNQNSTAKGTYQFLDGTWQYVQNKSGVYGSVFDPKLNANNANYLLATEGTKHWRECL